jgi:hypothetical protein
MEGGERRQLRPRRCEVLPEAHEGTPRHAELGVALLTGVPHKANGSVFLGLQLVMLLHLPARDAVMVLRAAVAHVRFGLACSIGRLGG